MGNKTETMRRVYEEAIELYGFKNIVPFDNVMLEYHAGQTDFKNKFDAPKLDYRHLLPQDMKKNFAYIIPCGKGEGVNNKYHKKITARYIFVHGSEQNDGYLNIPLLKKEDFIAINPEKFNFCKSDISLLGEAEANSISTLGNYGIGSYYFLNDVNNPPIIHDSRRTKHTGEIYVPTKDGDTSIQLNSVQIEIDGFWEWKDLIVVLEGKAFNFDSLQGHGELPNICWRQLLFNIEYITNELKRMNSKKNIKYAVIGEVKNHPFGSNTRAFFIVEYSFKILDKAKIIYFSKIKGFILPPDW